MDLRVLQGVSRAALADRAHQEEQDQLALQNNRQERATFQTYLQKVADHPQMPDAAKEAALHAMIDISMKGDKSKPKDYQMHGDNLWRSLMQPRPTPYSPAEQSTINMNSVAPSMADAINSVEPGMGSDMQTGLGQATAAIPTGSARPQRTGLLTGEEVAAGHGREARAQMDALTGGTGGMGSGSGGSNMTPIPTVRINAKGQPSMSLTERPGAKGGGKPEQKNYTVNGARVFGIFDPSTQRIHDHSGTDITDKVDGIQGNDGVRWVQAQNPDTLEPEWQALNRNAMPGTAGPAAPVRMNLLPTETSTGEIGTTAINPYNPGAQKSKIIPRGQKTNADVRRQSIQTGTAATQTRVAIQKGTYKNTIDPNAFPDTALAAGVPMVDTGSGTPEPIGTRLFTASKEPGSVLQRASTARVVVKHSEDTAKMVEDPQNAQFFGKVSGRVSELLTEGPTAFGHKVFGPIGTNDPRLTQLHGAIKSISDLLTTVHGRRAEESARNFERSLSMANGPKALAAIIRQYAKIADEVAAEGAKPVVPISGTGSGVGTGATRLPGAGSGDPSLDALRALAAKIAARPDSPSPSTVSPPK